MPDLQVRHAPAPKPNLLFITPVVPEDAGNGLAMRGAMFLRALAPLYNVLLHVVPVFAGSADPGGSRCVIETCAEAAVQPLSSREDPLYRMVARIREPRLRLAALVGYPKPSLCRFATAEALAELRSRYAGRALDAVHVSRLYLAPFAAPFLDEGAGIRPVCRVDLDDLESRAGYRLAELYAANGDEAHAYLERAEVAKYQRLEDACLPRFDTVFTASEADLAALARRYGRHGSFIHAPNAVRLPADAAVGKRDVGGPFTLLFVGTLNYYPNEDAAFLLCREVLPLVRERAGGRREVRLVIAGALPSAAVRALAEAPGVAVAADVPDLAPLYTEADVALAPVRAGGGTRIKVLEAFAPRRPVVATTVGAEGIDARHGEHLLIADSPAALAAACLRLMERPDEAAEMARRAFDLVRSTYDLDRVRRIIARSALPR